VKSEIRPDLFVTRGRIGYYYTRPQYEPSEEPVNVQCGSDFQV